MPPEAPTLEAPPTATPSTPSPALEDFDRTFADLDTTPAPAPTPAQPSTPAPSERSTPPKDPETGKFTKPSDKPEPAPAPAPKPQTEAPKPEPPTEAPKGLQEFDPPQVAKPSELRTWAKRMGSRAEQAERQLSQLNAKIRQLETQHPNVDVGALTKELADAKKRLDDYEGELKVTRYERSGEYKDKYEKPYQNAVKSAYNEVGELLVTVPNPNDPDNPQERQATAQDFDEVYALPLGQAAKLARQKFGDSAPIVIGHIKAIKGAAKAALDAIGEHKGKAAEFEQQETAQKRLIEEGRSRMFGEAVNAIVNKYPALFGERDGDSAWNENLNKGRSMADLAYSDRKTLTPAQSAILDAQIHARISAFPALRVENESLKSQLAAKDKEISELRGSGPGKPSSSAPKTESAGEMTMEAAFDKMVPS